MKGYVVEKCCFSVSSNLAIRQIQGQGFRGTSEVYSTMQFPAVIQKIQQYSGVRQLAALTLICQATLLHNRAKNYEKGYGTGLQILSRNATLKTCDKTFKKE